MSGASIRSQWLALTVVSLAFAASADADRIEELVARFIASEVQRLGGSEYEEARSIKRSAANDRDQVSVAALYTIEGVGGGNNYTQYLVAFLDDGTGLQPSRVLPLTRGHVVVPAGRRQARRGAPARRAARTVRFARY